MIRRRPGTGRQSGRKSPSYDKCGSQAKTFERTAQAVKELAELVGFIVNNF